ncbi:MAG: DUF4397 domain-containing protein [Pseudomonadota bacterium]
MLLPVVLLATAGMAGCDIFESDDDDAPASPPIPITPDRFRVQVLHASPDAPAVNLLINGNQVAGGVDYKEGTLPLEQPEGEYTVQVDGITPGGDVTVIGPATLQFDGNLLYSVLAVNDVANIEPLIINQDDTDVPAGLVRARVVHAAPAAPAVDVFVTAPGADLTAEMPLGSFSFRGDLGPVEVPAGDYQIRVTLAGDASTVVYDSGTVALAGGGDLLLAAVQNTGTGSSPIQLVGLDSSADATTDNPAFEILDAATPTRLRVVHASPDAPDVDVVVNDDFANPLVNDLPFPTSSGFVDVPPATYNVKVTPFDNAGVVVIDADLDLLANEIYSVLAVGLLADIEALVLSEDPRPVATAAKVRIVHGSPSAGNVDIYVTAPGTDISGATPAFADIPFKASTGFVELAAGDYEVTVTPTGTTTAAIGPAAITIDNTGVYTAIARDADGGGTPLGLILLDNFVDPVPTGD